MIIKYRLCIAMVLLLTTSCMFLTACVSPVSDDVTASQSIQAMEPGVSQSEISLERYGYISDFVNAESGEITYNVEYWNWGIMDKFDMGFTFNDYDLVIGKPRYLRCERGPWQVWDYFLNESQMGAYPSGYFMCLYNTETEKVYELMLYHYWSYNSNMLVPPDYKFFDDTTLYLGYREAPGYKGYGELFDLETMQFLGYQSDFNWADIDVDMLNVQRLSKNPYTNEWLIVAYDYTDSCYKAFHFDSARSLQSTISLPDEIRIAREFEIPLVDTIIFKWRDDYAVVYPNYQFYDQTSVSSETQLPLYSLNLQQKRIDDDYDATWALLEDVDAFILGDVDAFVINEEDRFKEAMRLFYKAPYQESVLPYLVQKLNDHRNTGYIYTDEELGFYLDTYGLLYYPILDNTTIEQVEYFHFNPAVVQNKLDHDTIIDFIVLDEGDIWLIVCLTDLGLYCAPFNPSDRYQRYIEEYDTVKGEYVYSYERWINTYYFSQWWMNSYGSAALFEEDYKDNTKLIFNGEELQLHDGDGNYLLSIWLDGSTIYNIIPE